MPLYPLTRTWYISQLHRPQVNKQLTLITGYHVNIKAVQGSLFWTLQQKVTVRGI